MRVIPTAMPDVMIIEPRVFTDERGFFMETWQRRKFAEMGIEADFVQENHSRSIQGTLRGLHYQSRRPQGKLVRVTAGEVFDVVVDLRRSSPTFGRWEGHLLSAENVRMVWMPPEFAHGFYVLSDFADFQYKCTDYYSPGDERCIRWDDPELAIEWPLVHGVPPLVSLKDAAGVLFRDAECFP